MGRARVVLGFFLTGVFLYLALHSVEWAQVGDALGRANYVFLLPAALLTLTGYALRTVRWQRILGHVRPVSLRRLFPVLIVGFAANNVLPARMGELVRAYGVGQREGVSKTLALATILLERVCDGVTLLLFLGVVLLVFPAGAAGPEVRVVALLSVAVFVGAAGGLVGLRRYPQWAGRFLAVATKFLPSGFAVTAQRMMANFVLGLGSLSRASDLLALVATSILIWSCEMASYFLVMQAFALPLTLFQQALASAFVLVFVNLGIMLPSAPGYVGTFQFFARMALSAFGVGGGVGFAFAVISHALQYALVTSLGLIYFWRAHLTLSVGGEEVGSGLAVAVTGTRRETEDGKGAPSVIEG